MTGEGTNSPASFRQAAMSTSLRTAIAAAIIGAIVVVASAIVYFSIREYQSLYRRAAADDLHALSKNLSSDLIPILAGDVDLFEATNVLLRLDQYAHVRFAAVLDRDREVLTQYIGPAALRGAAATGNSHREEIRRFTDASARSAIGVAQHRDALVAFKQIGAESLPQGFLLISTDLAEPLKASTYRLLHSVVPLAGTAMIIILLVLTLLLARLFRPLLALGEFTQKIRISRDYSLQASITGTREISELTTNFNSMMRDINNEVETNKRQNELLLSQQEQMEKLANFDSLTGLSNRQFFMQTLRMSLSRARREQHDFSVLFLDVDGFKGINDSYGHEVGDKLLEQIGRDIREHMRDSDLVARLGGDEFLIMLGEDQDVHAAMNTSERLIKTIGQSRNIEGWRVQVGASVGVATAKGADYDLSELMIHADVAMYRSKLSGKGRCTAFAAEMAEDEQRQLHIANAIVPALERDEFELHYQPKVNATGKTVSYEALIRWHNPLLGQIAPDEFIPIAEKSGHIREITAWVVNRGCRDLPTLHDVAGEEITLALNLSVHDLRNVQLADDLTATFEAHNVDPSDIELEVTETAYLENFDTANMIFKRVRALGCRIALDDFGTGYSSLGYLTKISIDSLKIDKQFVDRVCESERDSLLTRTIIEMANQLGLTTVAEGVESPEQAKFLFDNGCDLLQGYFCGRPASLATLIAPRDRQLRLAPGS